MRKRRLDAQRDLLRMDAMEEWSTSDLEYDKTSAPPTSDEDDGVELLPALSEPDRSMPTVVEPSSSMPEIEGGSKSHKVLKHRRTIPLRTKLEAIAMLNVPGTRVKDVAAKYKVHTSIISRWIGGKQRLQYLAENCPERLDHTCHGVQETRLRLGRYPEIERDLAGWIRAQSPKPTVA